MTTNIPENGTIDSVIFPPPRTGEWKHWIELSQWSVLFTFLVFVTDVFPNIVMLTDCGTECSTTGRGSLTSSLCSMAVTCL